MEAVVPEELRRLLEVAALCNETDLCENEGTRSLDGSPTEAALVRVALDSGIDVASLRRAHPVLRTNYRTEQRGYMTTLHDIDVRLRSVIAASDTSVYYCCLDTLYRLEDLNQILNIPFRVSFH